MSDMSLEDRVAALERTVADLNTRTIGMVRMGPRPRDVAEERARMSKASEEAIQRIVEKIKPVPPVDRSAQVLTTGEPVPADRSHTEIESSGMQKAYVVLTPEERRKGYVMPYRHSYKHLKCGVVTRMGEAIAGTYARDPGFYNGTYCVGCHTHFPLGEFTWEPDGQSMDMNKWSLAEQEALNAARQAQGSPSTDEGKQ